VPEGTDWNPLPAELLEIFSNFRDPR